MVLLVALAPFWLPLPLPTLFLTVALAVPAGVIVAGLLLRAFQVRPAWPAALLGCALSLAGIYLVRQSEYASNLLVAAVVVAAYGVAAAVTTPGLWGRATWRRSETGVPFLAPDVEGYRLAVMEVGPGVVRYRLLPSTGFAPEAMIEVTIRPVSFGGLEGRIVERLDATVAITAGPDVPETVVEVVASTLAHRPHLFS
ncbi:hypothetical protein [Herbidospora galbida]|uniref:hypothetical protein n=1 Tax=Herbidospora galbida TaxID=2575442 RepID=UPI0010C22FDB|nr:hypothetical protein [Herbidospora galbida]